MKLHAAIAASLIAAAPAAAQTLTIREARALPGDELARRMLGAAGALYPEIERPGPHAGHSYPAGGPIGLSHLAFATAPRFSGFPGLCEAETVSLAFVALLPATDADPDPPARVSRIATHMRYRIVGPAEPRPRTAEADRRGEAICSASGPVLEGEMPQRRFFTGTAFGVTAFEPGHAAFAARALLKAQSAVHSGSIRVRCTPEPDYARENLCANAADRIAGLDPATVHRFALERCTADPRRLCVEAHFRTSQSDFFTCDELIVSIETDAAIVDPGRQRFDIRSVGVDRQTWVV